jgi:serine/threonine protein phosphatase 1
MFQFFGRKARKGPQIAPDTRGRTVYAIGDIHGRLDLLDLLLELIAKDAQRRHKRADKPMLIFLGDYIDRGRDSRGVIERIVDLKAKGPFEVIPLMGNHERALLNFLKDPVPFRGWLDYGGQETLESYGIPAVASTAPDDELIDCAAKLESQIGSRLDFLRSLKLWHLVGSYLFVHAGVRPGLDLDQQVEKDLLWIRSPFLTPANHGLPYTVVHGHTPEPTVRVRPDRISLDTGAYASGILSAARIEGDQVEVFATPAN